MVMIEILPIAGGQHPVPTPARIDVLLLEGTTLGRTNNVAPKSEDAIEEELAGIFRETTGIVAAGANRHEVRRS